MLNNIKIGRYYNDNSFVHSLCCFTKIILLILYCIIISFSNLLFIILIISILTLYYLKLTNVPYKYYFKSVWDIKYLLIFIFILNIIFKTDIVFIIISILKIILLLLFSLSFIYTSSINDMLQGFYCILRPFKFLDKYKTRIVFILTVAIKFIPCVIIEYNKKIMSLKSRNIYINKLKIKDKIYIYKVLIISLFKSVLKQADNMSDNLMVRNYRYDYENKLIMNLRDYFMIDIFLIVLLGVVICAI